MQLTMNYGAGREPHKHKKLIEVQNQSYFLSVSPNTKWGGNISVIKAFLLTFYKQNIEVPNVSFFHYLYYIFP